jgi:DNA polymerase-3 subunit delta'
VDDPERLLPTVRSRCQRVRLAPPDVATAEAWLVKQGVAGAAALLPASGGEPLAAKALVDEGLSADVWASLPAQVAGGDTRQLAGMPLPRAVRVLQQVCHDAMAQAAGGAPRFFLPGQVPAGATLAALAEWAAELARVARHDEHPWNAPLRVEALVAQGRRAWAGG